MLEPHRSCRALATLAIAGLMTLATARAQTPALLSAVEVVPPAASRWEQAERTRSPMVARSAFVRIDTAALAALPPGGAPPLGTFALALFEQQAALEITSRTWTLDHRVFHGRIVGRTSEVHLVLSPSGLVWGSIDIDATSFVLAPTGVGDVHVLQHIDQTLLPPHMSCGTDHNHEVAAPAVSSLVSSLNTNCSLVTIDVMVFYTPQAQQNAGGTAAMEAAIVGAIAQANAAHIASGVPAEFRLVHAAETQYTELGTGTDLSRFRTDQDGFMDEVHALRTTYGADLMHLITDPASASYCGIGYLMTNLSVGFASSAFAVTVRGCIPNRTFTHESGHNMGCHHDAANAGTALYPYSYGYRTPDNAYRTIMAYAPGTRINRWSSPNVDYLGYTMGVAGSADNALSLVNTCATVAQFAATQAPNWCDLDGGVPGAIGVPVITGSGTINLADPLQVTTSNYAPNAVGVLAIGASAISFPAFGGTIVPSPDVLLAITGNGDDIVQNVDWLATLPPAFEVWFQAVILDPSAAQGIAASDAVKVTIP